MIFVRFGLLSELIFFPHSLRFIQNAGMVKFHTVKKGGYPMSSLLIKFSKGWIIPRHSMPE